MEFSNILQLSNELLWFIMLLANFLLILVSYRLFGKVGLFTWTPVAVILANIQVLKAVELFGLSATLGNITYASSFLVTDILSENYGRREAQRAVYIGFLSLIAMTVLMQLALLFAPSEADFAHGSLQLIFGIMPRLALASLTAYGLSQLHDVWAYHFWKIRKPGKKFIWLRNNLSTMVSQAIDTVVFTVVAFAGVFTGRIFWEIMATTYLFKVIVAALDTPFLYIARSWKDKKRVQ